MTLQDAKIIPKLIQIPDNFQNRITILTNCELTTSEVDIFNLSLKVVSEYIEKHDVDITGSEKFNIVFTNDGSFSFFERDGNVFGAQLQLAIYNMSKIRSHNYHYIMMFFVFIEELAHYFLRIYDETLIKRKVSEMIQYVIPEFDLNNMKGMLYGI